MIAKDIVRYTVEHRYMPFLAYAGGLGTSVKLMTAVQDTMQELYHDAAAQVSLPGYESSYDFTETDQAFDREEDRVLIVRIGMPEPKEALQCRAAYICFSRIDGKGLYFTSELNHEGAYVLCAWSRDGVHLNFGNAPETAQEEMKRIVTLFWKVEANGYREKFKSLRAG